MTRLTHTRPLVPELDTPWWDAALHSLATPVTVIWAATAVTAIAAPDMVTGSEHEHLPIAAMSIWIWASLATAYTTMAVRHTPPSRLLALGVSAVWAAVAIGAVAAPVMVTGSDPTRIPFAAIFGPVLGTLTTAFLALHHATTPWPQRG